MKRIALPKPLRILLWILGAHEAGWFVYGVVNTVLNPRAIVFLDMAFRISFLALVLGCLAGSRVSVRVLSWVFRIWGVVAVIGTIGAYLSDASVKTWVRIDAAESAAFYVLTGWWLTSAAKRPPPYEATSYIPVDAAEPYVAYPRK